MSIKYYKHKLLKMKYFPYILRNTSIIFLIFIANCSRTETPLSDSKIWQKEANDFSLYEIGTIDDFYKEKQVYYIKSAKKSNDWGAVVKRGSQDQFLNNKARLSCYIKTQNIIDKVVLFVSVSNHGSSGSVYESTEIYGDNDWKKYELIIQYPDFTYTKYGIALYGNGKVLFSDLIMEPEGNYEIPRLTHP